MTPLPWSRLPKHFIEVCQRGEVPTSYERRNVVGLIAAYLHDELKDTSRGTARRAAAKLVQAFPNSFQDKIGESVVGDGVNSLHIQIYNRLNYYKNQRASPLQRGTVDEQEEEIEKPNKKIKLDEYGCIAYEPPLGFEETVDMQQRKKAWLLDQFQLNQRELPKVQNWMNETYPSQRISINRRKGLIDEIFTDWPFLREPEYLLSHASTLVGKSVVDIWQQKLSKHAGIHSYMQHHCLSTLKKKPQYNVIMGILEESKTAANNLRGEWPLVLGIFPLIAAYFKESTNYIFKIVDVSDWFFIQNQFYDNVEYNFSMDGLFSGHYH